MPITVYGASDDLIEIEGDIVEEFPYRLGDNADDEGDLVAFSNGTILKIRYTNDGIWRITTVVRGAGDIDIVQAPEDDDRNYTDRATVSGAMWVVHGIGWAR
jgi:hypothetical protein